MPLTLTMVQKSRVGILEQDASELQTPRESGDNDFLVCGGLSFKNSDDFLLERIGDIIKFKYPRYSYKVNYSGDNISSVEFYNGIVQTTVNRIAQTTLNYSNDNVTSEQCVIYDSTDGTTVLKTVTSTYTYSGDFVTNVTVSEV